ncbi:MAG: SpoIIIAC/SpoIIIAD family protein [Anaerobutyricum sp.]|nr:stage III sporulation protein AD [Eubacterium sp.]MDY6045634.1 SpoIIIAC/SpoIIIAD family protein [Anaerobutyricum sp.]
MVVLKIALIGIGGAILAVVVRQFQKEYSVFVLLAVCLFLVFYLTSNVSLIIDFAQNLGEKIHISGTYIRILFKLLAIAYICQIASNICQDLGYQSVSFQIELIGKLSILTLSIPIINSLLETIEQLM